MTKLPLLLLSSILGPSYAIYKHEAGLNDFLIRSSGHGPPNVIHSVGASSSVVVTAQTSASCIFAAHNIDNGEFLWRRDACSTKVLNERGDLNSLASIVFTTSNKIVTLDLRGVVRFWDEDGDLHADSLVSIENGYLKSLGDDNTIAVYNDSSVQFVLGDGKVTNSWQCDAKSNIFDVIADGSSSEGSLYSIVTKKAKNNGGYSIFTVKGLLRGDDDVLLEVAHKRNFSLLLDLFDGNIFVGCTAAPDGRYYTEIDGDGSYLTFPDFNSIGQSMILAEDTKLIRWDEKQQLRVLQEGSNRVIVDYYENGITEELYFEPTKYGSVKSISLVGNSALFVSTTSGTTNHYQLLMGEDNNSSPTLLNISLKWTVEEAFSSVKNVVFVDQAIPITEDFVRHHIDLKSRLELQKESFVEMIKGIMASRIPLVQIENEDDKFDKDHDRVFGFHKLAILLTDTKLIAIDTLKKGEIVWEYFIGDNLKQSWIIHNSAKVLFVGERENNELTYNFFDIHTGEKMMASDSIITTVSKHVSNLYPVQHDDNDDKLCLRVLYDDLSTDIIGDIDEGGIYVDNASFVHQLVGSSLKTFQLENNGNVVSTTGIVTFDGEEVVTAAYPKAETILSPALILGDDSLLVKYLNPNLAVIITTAIKGPEEEMIQSEDFLLLSQNSDKKNKPRGVAPEQVEKLEPASLFVNLVDTVSGQILARVSHSNARPFMTSGKADVPITISENWVVYSFYNSKAQRSEVGVLSLFEGMIEKYALTAFKNIEQDAEYSSFTAASKPALLHKTFTIGSAPITAISATQTNMGITPKHFLFATTTGQVLTFDRRLLDPRRPLAEPTKSEKEDGLMQYMPVLPILSDRMVLTYSNQVEGLHILRSSSVGLESQSLVIAAGSSDVFFTRIAPSKGFDVLPESFNKGLLSLIVIALVFVTHILKAKGDRKLIRITWA